MHKTHTADDGVKDSLAQRLSSSRTLVLGWGQGEDGAKGYSGRALQDRVCSLTLTKRCSLMAFQARGEFCLKESGEGVRSGPLPRGGTVAAFCSSTEAGPPGAKQPL